MKTIGLVGDRNWEATASYYKLINLEINKRLGEHHAVRIASYTVDYKMVEGKISELSKFAEMVVDACQKVVQNGAEVIVLTTNSMHLVEEYILKEINVPVIHIADAVGGLLKRRHCVKVGLLGSNIITDLGFYPKRLAEKYGLETVLPSESEQLQINNLILDELSVAELASDSHKLLVELLKRFRDQQLDGVVMASPELTRFLKAKHINIKVFEATELHAEAIVAWALGIAE